jgi:hypothetical protein
MKWGRADDFRQVWAAPIVKGFREGRLRLHGMRASDVFPPLRLACGPDRKRNSYAVEIASDRLVPRRRVPDLRSRVVRPGGWF